MGTSRAVRKLPTYPIPDQSEFILLRHGDGLYIDKTQHLLSLLAPTTGSPSLLRNKYTPNVELQGHGEGPDVNPGLTAEKELEGIAGHLDRDMRAQTAERPAGQMLQVPTGVLHFVAGAFDPFPQTVEPPLYTGGPDTGWRVRGSRKMKSEFCNLESYGRSSCFHSFSQPRLRLSSHSRETSRGCATSALAHAARSLTGKRDLNIPRTPCLPTHLS